MFLAGLVLKCPNHHIVPQSLAHNQPMLIKMRLLRWKILDEKNSVNIVFFIDVSGH